MVGRTAHSPCRRGSPSSPTARSVTSASPASVPASCARPNRHASSAAVVGAGDRATVRSAAPAVSARRLSRSHRKSPPASMLSASAITSPPPLTPRRRCLISPMRRSSVPTRSSRSASSATSSSPALGVCDGSSKRNSTRAWPRRSLLTIQVPSARESQQVSQPDSPRSEGICAPATYTGAPAICGSRSEEARSVADGRERALAKAEAALGKTQRGLGGRYYKTRNQVDAKVAQLLGPAVRGLLKVTTGTRAVMPTLRSGRDQHAIGQAARTGGVYALATNLPGRLSATKLLRLYKDQLVELRHRDAKQTLRVRPIFLHNDDRIDALVSVVGLALVVFGLIETDLRGAVGSDATLQGLLPEGRADRPTARNILAAFQGLGLTHTHHGIVLDRLTRTQRRILQLLTIPIPWPEQAK